MVKNEVTIIHPPVSLPLCRGCHRSGGTGPRSQHSARPRGSRHKCATSLRSSEQRQPTDTYLSEIKSKIICKKWKFTLNTDRVVNEGASHNSRWGWLFHTASAIWYILSYFFKWQDLLTVYWNCCCCHWGHCGCWRRSCCCSSSSSCCCCCALWKWINYRWQEHGIHKTEETQFQKYCRKKSMEVEQKLLQKKLKSSMLSPTTFASSQDLLLRNVLSLNG